MKKNQNMRTHEIDVSQKLKEPRRLGGWTYQIIPDGLYAFLWCYQGLDWPKLIMLDAAFGAPDQQV